MYAADTTRFKQDNTLKGYNGPIRMVLAEAQKALKLYIAIEDGFPDPEVFKCVMKSQFKKC